MKQDIIIIGPSDDNIKSMNVDPKFVNNVYLVNKKNWASNDTYDDEFKVQLIDGRATCQRLDLASGWGMNLIIYADYGLLHMSTMGYNFVWSKGPLRTEYSSRDTETISDENTIVQEIMRCNGRHETQKMKGVSRAAIIWIRASTITTKTTDLDYFAKNINMLNQPTILITSDGDRPSPSSYSPLTVKNILDCPKIDVWYTQNYDGTIKHQKLKEFPIGFDFHTKRWQSDDKIEFMLSFRNNPNYRKKYINKIFCDTHLTMSHPDRIEMYNTIKSNPFIDFQGATVSFKEITAKYNEYYFVLAPRGGGLDTHRIWELFLAGCIAITVSSSLDDMFRQNRLPVIILKNWNELNELAASNYKGRSVSSAINIFEEWLDQYLPLTSSQNILPKLTFEYWLNRKG